MVKQSTNTSNACKVDMLAMAAQTNGIRQTGTLVNKAS